MRYQRTVVFAGLLAVVVAAAVTGVAAQRGTRDRDRVWAEPVFPDEPGQRGSRVFIDRDDARRAIRLDGRGSQIGVVVSDPAEPGASGVRIDGVDDDSAAAKAGLREGDIVVDFDGERVRSARQLARLVQETVEGRAVKMTVTRDGARHTVDIAPTASTTAWNVQVDGPELRAQIERGLRGLRELPERGGPMFDFRFDGLGNPAARGRLGVQVETLSDQLADYFGVKGGGVLVSSVTADSPAQKAGLAAGDVITTVNGTAVRDAGELIDELRGVDGGGEVRLDVVRDKKATTVTATIERPAASRLPRRPI